jgi:hypothetical protein
MPLDDFFGIFIRVWEHDRAIYFWHVQLLFLRNSLRREKKYPEVVPIIISFLVEFMQLPEMK